VTRGKKRVGVVFFDGIILRKVRGRKEAEIAKFPQRNSEKEKAQRRDERGDDLGRNKDLERSRGNGKKRARKKGGNRDPKNCRAWA